jgi:hypothetical protein
MVLRKLSAQDRKGLTGRWWTQGQHNRQRSNLYSLPKITGIRPRCKGWMQKIRSMTEWEMQTQFQSDTDQKSHFGDTGVNESVLPKSTLNTIWCCEQDWNCWRHYPMSGAHESHFLTRRAHTWSTISATDESPLACRERQRRYLTTGYNRYCLITCKSSIIQTRMGTEKVCWYMIWWFGCTEDSYCGVWNINQTMT